MQGTWCYMVCQNPLCTACCQPLCGHNVLTHMCALQAPVRGLFVLALAHVQPRCADLQVCALQEIIMGTNVGAKADIYSFGALLWWVAPVPCCQWVLCPSLLTLTMHAGRSARMSAPTEARCGRSSEAAELALLPALTAGCPHHHAAWCRCPADCPAEVAAIVNSCLSPVPDERPTAKALVHELEHLSSVHA